MEATKNLDYLRQAIVIRKDLCMPSGKLAAMAAHASLTFLVKRLQYVDGTHPVDVEGSFTHDEWQWMTEADPGLEDLDQRSFAKIVLAVNSETELLDVIQAARDYEVQWHPVYDCGYSHNKAGDLAAVAVGPARPDKLKPVTGHLKVYR